MFRIDRLYTQPSLFKPVEFTPGFNIIFGEKTEGNDKNNGVGKSLCVEFINFALLKKKSESRLVRIPSEVFPKETDVCLDFTVDGTQYTLKRSVAKSEAPQLVGPDGIIEFAKLDDATAHLRTLVFDSAPPGVPSFRAMMGLLIRDERSEFKSLAGVTDTKRSVPDDYEPHLYLLGIDTSPYLLLVKNWQRLSDRRKEQSAIVQNVKLLRNKSVKDARADINELSAAADKIGNEINKLETQAGYDIIKDEVLQLEARMDNLRRRQSVAMASITKLKPLSRRVEIDDGEIGEFYENLKAGLGDIVSRDLKEVLGFKRKIEKFQEHVLGERRTSLENERLAIVRELKELSGRHKELLSVLDQEGNLKYLRQAYESFRVKTEELGQLKAFIGQHEKLNTEIQTLKLERMTLIQDMQTAIGDVLEPLLAFEKTILEIHEFIQGNSHASFEIHVRDLKHAIDLVMRIDSDGAHSVDREKVFIYDFALLLNRWVAERHPGFLVHDNIFEVDQDTLVKSLGYVLEEGDLHAERQYILTLNSDRLENEQELLARVEPFVQARFTKANRFLGRSYQEVRDAN